MSPRTENVANIAEYQEWERRAGPSMRSRYADFLPRDQLFEVQPNDLPRTIPGYRIRQSGPGLLTVSVPNAQGVAIRGLSATTLASALSLLNGQMTVLDLSRAAQPRWPLPVWRTVLQALLGNAVDLPATFSALSAMINRSEIVRFPEQPSHAILRSYWLNAAAVRRQLPELYRSLDDGELFRAALARLHVLATIGEDNNSFYGGYGLIPTVPGGYREIAVQTAIPETLTRTLDHWSSSLGTGPISRGGETATPRGQIMNIVRENGTIVEHATVGATLFLLLDEAKAALNTARAARAADRIPEALHHLAVFHQIFVNAHPFANINHSIAMNIVNDCLRGAGAGPVPHLFLDYLAQRLPPHRFATAFAAAVNLYALRHDHASELNRSLARSAALYWRYRADRDGATPRPEARMK
jgi:hypothetical protein